MQEVYMTYTPLVSRRRAKVLSFAVFLIGLAIVSYLNIWWPGIMLAIGIPLAMRQYLLGRHYDMLVSIFVFVGVFITVQFNVSWQIVLPVLFTLGGIYLLFREFIESSETPTDELEEDLNVEIEEKNKRKRKK